MTDQIPDDLADKVRKLAARFRQQMEPHVSFAECVVWERAAEAVEALLSPPPRPTLADMTDEERAACQWMQCDAGPYGRRGLIVKVKDWSVHVADKETGVHSYYSPDLVTARPDLPRMKWDGTPTAPDHLAVGTVIESADDPQIDALPVGSILLDCDGETAIKRGEAWTGDGYTPIPDEGDVFGPWTVLHIPKEEIS